MSSTLRRLSIRRPVRRPDHVEVHEFCVLKPSLRTFSLAELKKATRNFSKENIVGRGGFAKVYRGSLPGGELVAVKKLTAAQGIDRVEGFLSELGHVVNVSHPNIARLVGVGVDGGEHLVFPFSRLGCLSGMLHGSGGAEPMAWEARYRVAVGTARGLEYLHERCARRIVHRDIKPANILLMDNYEPLICDFGLARWMPAKLTHLQVTVFEGTFGYVPPEYTTHGVFSEKTDVFALGVVLLELLTGRCAIDTAKLSLVSWAKQYLDDDDGEGDEMPKMADPALGGRYDAGQLRNMAWAAKLCVHSSPDHRPQMSKVVRILVGEGTHPCVEGHRGTHHLGELHETDGYDAAPGYLDDLSRHKALAFDFDGESTPRTYGGS
ncbi:Receptor-like cytosolic serine/threonine-protein kinase RBK2 [Dichanthelium oligosanthes]|uniref:Receptor-like cytosolic serine/threonine-protein kinase RBK2 n=1 Tax=Dichanthelium oligosanthes TaxID=888268 RepID=A0A1E5VIZ8_9POAL|nr:Receptor-like cytosolic serine/threonine-protein kinase RBK2 [Dichanthelium oligosanthes]